MERDKIVRLPVSFDMGWSKRGAGRNYDSLNGYGAIIGCESGLILNYGTRNRKCVKCDIGHSPSDHNCRLNFCGSAKAMESDLAAELMTESSVLKACNAEVVIFVGDDDSCSIKKVRERSNHTIVKLSDRSHTSKDVTKTLYAIQKKHKELTKEAIDYLHICFSYTVAQNENNVEAMASTLSQIPQHAFNNHTHCGMWCRFKGNEANYDHGTIPGGFNSQSLLHDLQNIFEKLADNCIKFAHGVSSQLNENLNHVMSSKCPKTRCYSRSESADFRFACSVSNKNLGEKYVENVIRNLNLSSTSLQSLTVLQKQEKKSEAKRERIKSKEFKSRRNTLKKNRTALRHRKEKVEGTMYESSMGLMDQSVLDNLVVEDTATDSLSHNLNKKSIVFFDLETSGLTKLADILQIGAACESKVFGVYVKPKKAITASASAVNHLTSVGGNLYYNGKPVPTVSLLEALQEFVNFLTRCGQSCVLIAHNAIFDQGHLIRALQNTKLLDDFKKVVTGFVDTFPLFRKKLNRKNMCDLEYLAQEVHLSTTGAHNAVADVKILQDIVNLHEISKESLLSDIIIIEDFLMKDIVKTDFEEAKKSLSPFDNLISTTMKNRMAAMNITFNNLIDTFVSDGVDGIKLLFTEIIDGKPRVTKSLVIIEQIVYLLKMVTEEI